MSKALIVVDVQRDFVEGGSLAVRGGRDVAIEIADYLDYITGTGVKMLATKDWHNPNGTNNSHFSSEPDFINTWPSHCVARTHGAMLAGTLDERDFNDVFLKGWGEPAYSGFQGKSMHNNTTTLAGYLGAYEIDEVDICGIATDYCVKATVLDALKRNLKVNVIANLTVAVGDKQAALDEMSNSGANIV